MNPTAFKIGEVAIHWYGLMMALGFLGAYFVASRHARRIGFRPEYVADSVIAAIIGGLLGARINYLISYWPKFVEHCAQKGSSPWARIFYVHEGGLVFLGGFFGAAIAVAALAKIRGVSVMQLADMAAMGVPIGHMFGRIGCFMTSCCFGKPTDGPISISYPVEHYKSLYAFQIEHGLVDKAAQHCHPLLPSQLFASMSNLLIFIIIYVVMRSRKLKKSGQLFGLYLMIYPVARFINAFFRGDHDDNHRYWRWLIQDGLTEAQRNAPFIILAGIAWFILAKLYAPEVPEYLPLTSKNKTAENERDDTTDSD